MRVQKSNLKANLLGKHVAEVILPPALQQVWAEMHLAIVELALIARVSALCEHLLETSSLIGCLNRTVPQ